ncbi:MAG: hypothetical protein WCH39_14425, partial [Schlesneria sp.]
MRVSKVYFCAAVCWLLSISIAQSADWGMKEGTPELKSAGSLAFGPDGILFVGDSKSATIFAIATGDTKSDRSYVEIQFSGLNKQIATLLGTTPENITVNDLAVNPLTYAAFLSVTKGKGADATPAIVRVGKAGQLSEVSLKKIPFQKVVLPDAPEDKD